MPKGRVVLLTALGLVAGIETVGIFTDTDTISGLTSDLFRADTHTGRYVFFTAWAAFSVWYAVHIWRFRKSVKAAGSNTSKEK